MLPYLEKYVHLLCCQGCINVLCSSLHRLPCSPDSSVCTQLPCSSIFQHRNPPITSHANRQLLPAASTTVLFNDARTSGVPFGLLFIFLPAFPNDAEAGASNVWVNRDRNYTGEILLSNTTESNTVADILLITSNQCYASSEGIIIFTGGDYIGLEIKITYLSLSFVLHEVWVKYLQHYVRKVSHDKLVKWMWTLFGHFMLLPRCT